MVDIRLELVDDDVGGPMGPLLVVLVAELWAHKARCMVNHYCTHLKAERNTAAAVAADGSLVACTFPERVNFPSLISEADGTAGSLAALRDGSFPLVGGSPRAGSLERRVGFEEGRIVELQVDTAETLKPLSWSFVACTRYSLSTVDPASASRRAAGIAESSHLVE